MREVEEDKVKEREGVGPMCKRNNTPFFSKRGYLPGDTDLFPEITHSC
jgi:hypothetical protein